MIIFSPFYITVFVGMLSCQTVWAVTFVKNLQGLFRQNNMPIFVSDPAGFKRTHANQPKDMFMDYVFHFRTIECLKKDVDSFPIRNFVQFPNIKHYGNICFTVVIVIIFSYFTHAADMEYHCQNAG